MQVSGSGILITGGASGIGLACAQQLAAMGARILVVDNDVDALAELSTAGDGEPGIAALRCDIGDAAEVEALMADVAERFGDIDAVVNNAAILRDQTLVSRLGKRTKKHSVEDWNATLAANLTGTFLVAREAAAAWVTKRRPGVIINTSSVVRTGNPGQSAYAATKAAVEALTVTWAQELAPYRIRVAAISYGFAETGMTRRIPPYFLERIKARSPIGRFATVEELAEGCRFIIENDYFLGRTLDLDGGLRF